MPQNFEIRVISLKNQLDRREKINNLFDNKNIPVLFYLSPELFGQNIDINEWKQSIEKSLDKGLSASIGSNNLLLGSGQIELFS